MLLKKLASILLVVIVLCVFVMPAGIVKSDDGRDFGVVTINGVEMYKSKSGETYPIIIFDGKKCIKWHEFDIVPVKDVINCESGKSDMMLKNFINKYQKNNENGNKSKFYVDFYTGEKAGYNQMYSRWASDRLGFSEWDSHKHWWKYTIGNAGCFLCSTASELLRYGLKDPISHNNVDPVNLNEWLKNNGGFTGAELYFPAVANFPGIWYIIDGFDDFYGAAKILYQCAPNAPIICLHKQKYPVGEGYHFCLYVGGDGDNPYYWNQAHGCWDTREDLAEWHHVIDPGFNHSSDREGTVRNLWDVYLEGKEYFRHPYVRPDSGIFRVAFKR